MNKFVSTIVFSILLASATAEFEVVSESFQGNEFSDAQGWVVGQEDNIGQSVITVCDKIKMFAGVNKFGKKAIASKNFILPPHHTIKIKLQLWKIDTWDNEEFHVWVDDQIVWRRKFKYTEGNSNRCGIGGTAKEMVMNLDIDVKHSDPGDCCSFHAKFRVDEIFNHKDPEVEILLTSTVNEDASTESWGFREFQLYYEPKEECAILYTECDYKGASFEFCSKSPNFTNDNIPSKIRSIRIPPQGRVTLYENTDFKGKKVVFTEDQPCIKNLDYSLIQREVNTSEKWIKLEGQ